MTLDASAMCVTALRRLIGHRFATIVKSQAVVLDICDVLFRFFLVAERCENSDPAVYAAKSAIRWLSGDYFELADARRFGVVQSDNGRQPVSLREMASPQSVLVALAGIASLSGRAVVLCFDQMNELSEEHIRRC